MKINNYNILAISYLMYIFCMYTDITVMFSQTTYSVNENAGPARPELVLSNPSTSDVTVEVYHSDGSATGEYCSILINY